MITLEKFDFKLLAIIKDTDTYFKRFLFLVSEFLITSK